MDNSPAGSPARCGTEFREEFRLWRHLIVPGAAALLFLFPLWGILRPSAYTPMGVLLRQAVAGHPPVSW